MPFTPPPLHRFRFIHAFLFLIPSSRSCVLSDWLRAQLPSYVTYLIPEQGTGKKEMAFDLGCPSQENAKLAVTLEDFQNLFALVETTDGGPAWIHMMDKNLSSMNYQAWRRDPETGPPQFRSRTVFDDVKSETVRDFFWDDEFRMKKSGMTCFCIMKS